MIYDAIPNDNNVSKTADALRERGMEVFIVNDRSEALEKIKLTADCFYQTKESP